MTHFKKFKISKGLGGLKLMRYSIFFPHVWWHVFTFARDLAEYKDTMKLFQIPAVDEACEVLGEVSYFLRLKLNPGDIN